MRRAIRTLTVAAALAAPLTQSASAQAAGGAEGTAASTVGGLVLGGYSGATLGLLGSMLPCNRTMAGGRCVAIGVAAAGSVGLAMGGLVGARNEEEILQRLRSAGWGGAAGAVVGVAMWRGVRQYGWTDALAIAAVGGAIGAAPVGAGIGAASGAAAGALVWWLVPGRGLPDFAALTLAGVMVGGLVEWGVAAADADGRPAPFSASFAIPIG